MTLHGYMTAFPIDHKTCEELAVALQQEMRSDDDLRYWEDNKVYREIDRERDCAIGAPLASSRSARSAIRERARATAPTARKAKGVSIPCPATAVT